MVLKASLSAALIDALSAALVDVMPTSWARKRARRCGEVLRRGFEEARTVAAPYSTEAADAAADAELGLSQDGLVDLARETGDEVGYAEGLRTANDALGTSYTVAEMRREGSRRASRLARPGRRPGQRADRRPGRHANRRPRWATESARARGRWRALPAAKERRDERVRQVAMTEARARIAAIDAGHRAAVEILSRLGFFPDESPSLGAKPASRTAAVTGDIDYGDDDDLEESARENHVEPKDDRPRVHASLGSESLAQRRADRRSQRRAGRRHAHLMGAQAARDAVERFYGADSEEARTVAAPYSTEAADAAADAELGLSQDGLVDLARETGDEVGYAEGLRTANDALGTSYTVAEMRREGSRRASGPAPGPAPGPARGPAPGPAPGPARGPTPESTPELTLMLGEGNGRAFSRLGDGVGALAGAGELSPRRRSDETSVCDRWP